MKKITKYQDKKVLILGLAKSGFAVANVLLELGAQITVNDAGDLSQDAKAQTLAEKGVTIIDGHHPVELFDQGFDYLLKNPGIPYTNVMVEKATELGVPIMTEPEVAFEVSEAPFVAITGSNGKTTTTMLTTEILNKTLTKGTAYSVGNIGVPIAEIAQKATLDDVLVAEMSSFQLLGVTTFKPYVAAIVDVYPTHLDYHETFANYLNAKLQITKNQDASDYFVVNFDQPEILSQEKFATKAQIKSFSEKDSQADYFLTQNSLAAQDGPIMPISDVKLPGEHNLQNALVASAIGKIFGATNETITQVLSTFSGAKHRLQYVKTLNGRKIYNDSKSTNIEAATVAINAFKDPEVLIAGGLDRGFNFDPLVEPFKNHIKAMVLYGETKQLLADAAEKAGITEVEIVDTLEEAVPIAYDLTASGDILLFSPACASWDQFKTFEERGDRFLEYINELVEE